MPDSFLQVNQLSAAYDQHEVVVNNVTFGLKEGELACLLGPSGCGKTTILRAISGFQSIRSGSIYLDGRLLSDAKTSVPPERRNVGMVFQDHALFPHLTIANNVGFGLHQLARSERAQRVDDMLHLVGMADYRNQYPHELSGGQSQRIALARALAPQPKLLLMDEPFSNLDTALRETLGYEVRSLLKESGITAIMVTHDQHDAFALGDQVGVMANGQLMQWDSSFGLYHAPNNRFVANFIGDGVFVRGQMVEDNVVITNFGEVRGESVNHQHIGKDVDMLIRPDDVKYAPESPIRARVTRKAFKGAQTLYTIETESGDTLLSLVPSHDDYEIGDVIGVSIEADHLVCFEQQPA
ncbi:ABC transporter ATP-binding protein [Arenicella xantha]|uniref:Iron(III) transport system ATP-binding protein n=1 Tax=Arenicella xantha TaxID=644221 RepID=A0A395JPW6_9GAMM|nr:ABC transporter ATP-binding protein [Arenicella xantha]RBP53383.1 iron(III) transport system ATP-binding protein [Arenicella xantha]